MNIHKHSRALSLDSAGGDLDEGEERGGEVAEVFRAPGSHTFRVHDLNHNCALNALTRANDLNHNCALNALTRVHDLNHNCALNASTRANDLNHNCALNAECHQYSYLDTVSETCAQLVSCACRPWTRT